MKKKYLIMLTILVSVTINSGCQNKSTADQNQKIKYKNGNYEAKTDLDSDGFYTTAKVKISNNKIADVQWQIIDQNGRVFDKTYEEVFPDSETYKQQCRNDYKGAITYGPELIKSQDVNKVDLVSGATWSYNKFTKVVSLALKKSEK